MIKLLLSKTNSNLVIERDFNNEQVVMGSGCNNDEL